MSQQKKMQQIIAIIEEETNMPRGSLWQYFNLMFNAYGAKIPRILERVKAVLNQP